MRAILRTLGVLGVLVVGPVVGLGGSPAPATAVPVPAHARLSTSTPAPAVVLPSAPAEVVLTFTRDIAAPATVVVTAPGGDLVGGEPAVVGPTVTTAIAARRQGSYTVAYRVVSVDGHPITGSYVFSVGHRSPPPGTSNDAGGFGRWWLPVVLGVPVVAGGIWVRRRSSRVSG